MSRSLPPSPLVFIVGILVGALAATGCAESPESPESPPPADDARVIDPSEAADMTLAEVLREDQRFSRFRELAETTETTIPGGSPTSWLDLWDWPAERFGSDRDGVTLFVPTDEAFAALEPMVLEQLEAGDLDNETRYLLLGNHYVHRLYPRSAFEDGPVRVWRGGAEMTLDPLTFGGHNIVLTDLRTANGYIHVIDGVVIPDAVQNATDP